MRKNRREIPTDFVTDKGRRVGSSNGIQNFKNRFFFCIALTNNRLSHKGLMSVKKSKNGFADYPDIPRTGSREPPESHHWLDPSIVVSVIGKRWYLTYLEAFTKNLHAEFEFMFFIFGFASSSSSAVNFYRVYAEF